MHNRRTLLLSFLVLAVAGSVVLAGTWARFRGPNGTGIVQGENVPVEFGLNKNLLWKAELPGAGNASPVVWEKVVFIHTASTDAKERMLLCLDSASGKTLWTRTIPAVFHKTHTRNTLASPTPATDGESVFVPFWDGKDVIMTAYNFKGDLLWQRNLGIWVSQHGTGTSPILYRDLVIYANDMDKEDPDTKAPVPRPSMLYALNKKTGEVVWQQEREAYRACYSAPFLLEKPGAAPELIVSSTTSIRSYKPDNGSVNWNWEGKFVGRNWPLRTICAPIHVDGMLFATSGDGGGDRHMHALQLNGQAAPTPVWENKKDFPYVPNLLHKDGHIYFVNDLGFAGCYQMKTGKRVWFERMPGANFTSSPVMIDGKIYAASEQGDVFVFAADPTFKLLAQNALGERFRASPAVADGKLYLRGQNHLFCIARTEK